MRNFLKLMRIFLWIPVGLFSLHLNAGQDTSKLGSAVAELNPGSLTLTEILIYGFPPGDPLHCAVAGGNLEAVKQEVEKRQQDLDFNNELQNMFKLAVHRAVLYPLKKSYIDILNYLIEYCYKNIHLVLINPTEGKWKGALNNSCNPNQNILYVVASQQSKDVMNVLGKIGSLLNWSDEAGDTPLHYAVISKNKEVVDFLLKYSPDVNAENHMGLTLLHRAVACNNLDIVSLLLNRNANVNANRSVSDREDEALTDEDITPLYLAAEIGNAEIIQILIQYNAIVSVETKKKVTPLHIAAMMHHTEAIKCLLENGASVNVQDQDGKTPLHYLSAAGILKYNSNRERMIHSAQILIQGGADCNMKDNNSKLPEDYTDNPDFKRYLQNSKVELKAAALTDAETRQYHRDDEEENGGGTGCPSGCVIAGPGIEVLLKNDRTKTVELDAETIAFLKQVKALMDSANEWSDSVTFMARAIEEIGMLEAMPHGTPWIEIVEMAFPEAQNNFFRAFNRAMEARRQVAAQEGIREEQLLNRMDRDTAFIQVGIDAQAIHGQTEPFKEEIMVGVTLNGHIFGQNAFADAELPHTLQGLDISHQNAIDRNAALMGAGRSMVAAN